MAWALFVGAVLGLEAAVGASAPPTGDGDGEVEIVEVEQLAGSGEPWSVLLQMHGAGRPAGGI